MFVALIYYICLTNGNVVFEHRLQSNSISAIYSDIRHYEHDIARERCDVGKVEIQYPKFQDIMGRMVVTK